MFICKGGVHKAMGCCKFSTECCQCPLYTLYTYLILCWENVHIAKAYITPFYFEIFFCNSSVTVANGPRSEFHVSIPQ